MNEHYPFTNPPLPYAYDALEPFIDTKTMELHHNRHLQTYVDNLNKTLASHPEYQILSLEQLLLYYPHFPRTLQTPIRNNAGGVYNHIFYFSNLTPKEEKPFPSFLENRLSITFGSIENFKKQFSAAALSVFGSGYAWLILDHLGNLKITTTANQNTPFSFSIRPLLNIDVWEHAYYLKHYNVRADYITDWSQIINWEQVEKNYRNALALFSL